MQVYMFLLCGVATDANGRLPLGARRTLLVFLKQDEEDAAAPNFRLCEAVIRGCGWSLGEFKGATPATPDTVRSIQKTPEPAVEQAYRDAFGKGFGVLVFAS